MKEEITVEQKESVFNKPLIEGNIYDFILKMFCSEDETHRVWMNKPFQYQNKAIATDAHVMVIMGLELVSDLPPATEDTPKSIDSLINLEKNLNFEIPLDILKEGLMKFDFAPELKQSGKYINCKECDGEGEVEWEYESYRSDFDCPVCDGSGYSSEPITYHTGNFDLAKYQKAKIIDCALDPIYLLLLYKTALILGEEKITLISQVAHNKSNLFRIGNIEALVMPLLTEKDEEFIFSLTN